MAGLADDSESSGDGNKVGNICKVLIIGAGISGITAASRLTQKGELDFKVLEARNRLGGRISSVPMGDQHVELGAEWIHGVLGNPIYEITLKHGLIKVNREQECHTVVATTEQGKRVPIHVVEEVYSAYFWFCKRCEEYFLLRLQPPPEAGNSVGKHLEKDISSYLEQFSGDEKHLRRMIFDHLLNRETCVTGCANMNETGLSDFGSYTELPGGNVTIPNPYYSVIECLVSELPEDCIRKCHEVTKIYWNRVDSPADSNSRGTDYDSKDSDCYSDVPDAQVQVVCANGKVFYARHIIVTLPLGVLKAKADALFEPSLPDYKLESFKNLCFGSVNKIFLEFDRPFLNPNISEIVTLWNKAEPQADIKENWFRKIYSFRKISDTILVAWLSGDEAEYAETLSEGDIAEVCTNALRKFLRDPYIPLPCRIIRTMWHQDPYTQGSYTSIGLQGSQKDIEMLEKPVYVDPYHHKPVLLFAGEATHSTFYSTVHGAYLSGIKAADILLEKDENGGAINEAGELSVGHLSSWLKGIDLD